MISAAYIDFLRSEANSVLANRATHTELERDFAKGILKLIDLIKDLYDMSMTTTPSKDEDGT